MSTKKRNPLPLPSENGRDDPAPGTPEEQAARQGADEVLQTAVGTPNQQPPPVPSGQNAPASVAAKFPHWTAVLDAKEPGHPHRMTYADLMDHAFPPLTWCIQDLVSGDGLTVLGGPKKQGKSWLLLAKAIAVATGGMVLGKQAAKGRVIYYVLEDGLALVKDRLKKLLPDPPGDLPITFDEALPPLNTDEGMEALCKDLETEPAVVFIDTLAAAKSGKIDENDAAAMGEMMNNLRRASMYYGVPVVLVHHHGKATNGDAGFALRGSSAIAGASHMNLSLIKGGWLCGEGKQVEKFRWGVRFDKETWRWERTNAGDATGEEAERLPEQPRAQAAPVRDEAEEWLLNYLDHHTETADLKLAAIYKAAKAAGIKKSAYYRARDWLIETGAVIKNDDAGTLEAAPDEGTDGDQ